MKIKPISAKNSGQKEYIRAIIEHDVVVCSGVAGTGKSMVAIGIACEHLKRGKVDKILISRPIIPAGKEIGFLRGDLEQKISPYFYPAEEYLKYFLGKTQYNSLLEDSTIEYCPIELLRGRTFNKTFMILDEAQNCELSQIKLFLTRMGENSKVIINGDVSQSDLEYDGYERNGLRLSIEKLREIEEVGIVELTSQQIVRNPLLRKILGVL